MKRCLDVETEKFKKGGAFEVPFDFSYSTL